MKGNRLLSISLIVLLAITNKPYRSFDSWPPHTFFFVLCFSFVLLALSIFYGFFFFGLPAIIIVLYFFWHFIKGRFVFTHEIVYSLSFCLKSVYLCSIWNGLYDEHKIPKVHSILPHTELSIISKFNINRPWILSKHFVL